MIYRFNFVRISGVALILMSVMLMPFATKSQFRYGIRVGGEINTSHLTGATDFSIKHGSGFSGGFTFDYMSESIGLGADISLLYTHGATRIHCGDPHSATREYQLGNDFIQIPLHAKYIFPLKTTGKIAGPFIYTGPTLLMRLDGDADGSPVSTRRLQPGWDLGAGFDIVNFIQLSAGYRFGLSDAFHGYKGLDGDSRLRNDGVTISVALLFDF